MLFDLASATQSAARRGRRAKKPTHTSGNSATTLVAVSMSTVSVNAKVEPTIGTSIADAASTDTDYPGRPSEVLCQIQTTSLRQW